jgi:hypothetical protein
MGWQYLLGVALIVFGAVTLALVDAPRRARWQVARLIGRARNRPTSEVASLVPAPPPGLWAVPGDSDEEADGRSTARLGR